MRARTLFLIVGIFLITGFAMLNVDEFTRTSVLSLGFTTMQVPLGLVMLLLVVAILLIFLASTIYMQSTNLIETRQYARELTAQRELADKAEASRFTELRQYMESQAALAVNRDALTTAAIDHRLSQTEALVLHRMDQSDNTAAAYWGQHSDSLMREARTARSLAA
jgi:uncharacterized integral membrane protein